ncbi:MAG: alpha-amylase family glycosyl hydrolase [Bacteroidetes bacterium]|nr:alpha-amylase family glycosyl hydrolase [Bacteroidota bacterium]
MKPSITILHLIFLRFFLLTLLLTVIAGHSYGQQTNVDVTFRWIPDRIVTNVFLPGEFNGWGPNSGGRINPNAPSRMTYDEFWGQWHYTYPLEVGKSYQYKIHAHFNDSGSNNAWITDPLNDRINPNDNNNSVLSVDDLMIFQMARHRNESGAVFAVSAGVFSSSEITSITVKVNDDESDGFKYFERGIIYYQLDEPIECDVSFKVTATNSEGHMVSDSVGLSPPAITNRARPSGIVDGLNYDPNDPSRVTLSVFAPDKCYMHVMGDFNDWEIDDSGLMLRDVAQPDSVYWWKTLENLPHGQEIGYQYVAEGDLRFADMFSTLILDEEHDKSISSTTYPNLKPYPSGKTTGPVSVLQTDQDSFSWSVKEFEPPAHEELVIYELLLRDFLHAHDWTTLTDTLGYLERLGINAIELMPIAEFGRNLNWGYQPNFFFAPDKYYGPAHDLKKFIDEAHKRDIAVILDVVYNHVDLPSPLVSLYGASNDNPWINIPPTHPYNVFFDLNHENFYTQYWLDRVNQYWLTEFNVDGFRFDLSKGFTQHNSRSSFEAWDRYDPSRIRLIKRMADAIWNVNPNAYIILEHWTQDQEERELASYGVDRGFPGMMVWSNVTHPFQEALMGYNQGQNSNFSRAYYGDGGRNWDLPHIVVYMESHDEQWLMHKMRSYGACERHPNGGNGCELSNPLNHGTYNIRHLPTALDRLKMAGAFQFLLPGPKMLWQFGELGYGYGNLGEQCLRSDGNSNDCPSIAPSRTGVKPIRWDYYSDPLRRNVYDAWSALLQIRREYSIFRSTATKVSMELSGDGKRIHLQHDATEMEAIIIGNFGVRPIANNLSISAPPVYWYDYFSGDSLNVTGSIAQQLQPGEFHIYTNQRLPPPKSNILTVSTVSHENIPVEFSFHGSYPNPFRSQTTIEFSLDRHQSVNIEVYDMIGRRVATLINDELHAGQHSIMFDAGALSSGLYTIRMVGNSGSSAISVALIQ